MRNANISASLLAAGVTFLPVVAIAHEGSPLEPHDLLGAWEFDPLIVICLAITAWLYYFGVRRLWKEAGSERGIKRWEARCYWAGWWSLVIALVSPVHPLGEVLFSGHMVQHEILMLISAPLLVLGKPLLPYLWALPISWRRRLGHAANTRVWNSAWRSITRPFTAWLLHSIAIWFWHAPALFQATLESDWIHTAQHVSFLGTALLFSWSVLHASRDNMRYGAAVAYVFTLASHTSLLGALLTFSHKVWYPVYDATTAAWGLTPLQDQQLGGLIMWIPAGVVYLAVGLGLFSVWMREPKIAATMDAKLLVKE